MVHAFAIELLWLLNRPEGSPASVTVTAHGVSKLVIRCAFIVLGPYSSSYLCAPRPSISLILDLIALTLSPTSPSHTSFIDNTHAIYGEAGHAPTCAYCLLSFRICLLGSHNITHSHCCFTMML